MDTVESLGDKEATFDCRMVPMSLRERFAYDQSGLNEMYKLLTPADPELDLTKAVVWKGKVYRVRDAVNSSEMDWIWITILEHIPQAELVAP